MGYSPNLDNSLLIHTRKIKRLNSNDDWMIASNGGKYKYRVDCFNCGECWHVSEDECYMVSESWEKMKAQQANNTIQPTG
jgi:hypothetical protein